MRMIRHEPPPTVPTGEGDRDVDALGHWIRDRDLDLLLHRTVGGEADGAGHLWLEIGEAACFIANAAGDCSNVHHCTNRVRRDRDLLIANRHQFILVEVPRFRYRARLPAPHRRERDVLDAVTWSVVAHPMDVPSEDGTHVAGLGQQCMDTPPILTVAAFEPSWMVQEDEDVLCVLAALEH